MGNSKCRWWGCRRRRSSAQRMSWNSLKWETAAGMTAGTFSGIPRLCVLVFDQWSDQNSEIRLLSCRRRLAQYSCSLGMLFLLLKLLIFCPRCCCFIIILITPQKNIRADVRQRSLISQPRRFPDHSPEEGEDAWKVLPHRPCGQWEGGGYIERWPADSSGGSRDQQKLVSPEGLCAVKG